MAMGRNRMLTAVGTADVIITNPTHFAVALTYDPTKGAPRVVARGADSMAAKIREHAAAANVPMVESPPLARVLFRSCRVDDEIPAALFQAVATVLTFVRRVERRAATGHMISLPLPDTWTPTGEDPETSLTRTRRRTPPRRRRRPSQQAPSSGPGPGPEQVTISQREWVSGNGAAQMSRRKWGGSEEIRREALSGSTRCRLRSDRRNPKNLTAPCMKQRGASSTDAEFPRMGHDI